MQEITVSARDAGQRLDKFLGKYLPGAPRSFFYKMLRKKNITLNGKKAAGSEKLEEQDKITLFLSGETIGKFRGGNQQERILRPQGQASEFLGDGCIRHGIHEMSHNKLDIVYEDEELLVVNKPLGMLSQKAEKGDISLVEYIQAYMSERDREALENGFRPGICNRLDRNTTGLVVAGKTVRSLQYMNRLFKERELEKYYLCLVRGRVSQRTYASGYLTKDGRRNQVRVEAVRREGAVEIETAYEPLNHVFWQGQCYTLLKVHLITGKSHQIRAHLQSMGHPIVGDAKYGDSSLYHTFKKTFGVRYQLLHAWQLRLGDASYLPERYHGMCLQAPVPEIFQRVLRELGMPRL